MSVQLIERSDEILKGVDIPDRSTFFQLKNFVLGKEPTAHGQLWAVIRNLQDRRSNIDLLEMQIDESEDNLALLNIKVERFQNLSSKTEDELTKREFEIEIRKIERQKVGLTNNTQKLKDKIRYILEEINYLVGAYETLVKATGGLKPWDDAELQRNYWNQKFTEELNLCFLLKKPVNTDLVQSIMALDDDMPVKQQMIQILQRVQSQMIEDRDRQLSARAVATAKIEHKKENNG